MDALHLGQRGDCELAFVALLEGSEGRLVGNDVEGGLVEVETLALEELLERVLGALDVVELGARGAGKDQ